jgi:hypothetical protein
MFTISAGIGSRMWMFVNRGGGGEPRLPYTSSSILRRRLIGGNAKTGKKNKRIIKGRGNQNDNPRHPGLVSGSPDCNTVCYRHYIDSVGRGLRYGIADTPSSRMGRNFHNRGGSNPRLHGHRLRPRSHGLLIPQIKIPVLNGRCWNKFSMTADGCSTKEGRSTWVGHTTML